MYDVISRGNERKPIVRDDDDREKHLDWLPRAVETYGWHLFAFVLMTNHEHVFLKTPEPNLSAGRRSHDASRAVAAYLARWRFGYPAKSVATALGYRDASAVSHAIKRIEAGTDDLRRLPVRLERSLK